MTPLIVKLALLAIDWLVKERAERDEIKRKLLRETAKYNSSVLDSVILRKEWEQLTCEFNLKG